MPAMERIHLMDTENNNLADDIANDEDCEHSLD